jgi:hypothetical protein
VAGEAQPPSKAFTGPASPGRSVCALRGMAWSLSRTPSATGHAAKGLFVMTTSVLQSASKGRAGGVSPLSGVEKTGG